MRNHVAVVVLGGILVLVLAGGYRLHSSALDEAESQVQDLELLVADTTAAALETELSSTARTLGSLATADGAARAEPLEQSMAGRAGCARTPCMTGIAWFAADGTPLRSAGRGFALPPATLQSAVEWARGRASGDGVRLSADSPLQPSGIVVITPLAAAGAPAPGQARLLAARIAVPSPDPHSGSQSASTSPAYRTLVLRADGSILFHAHVARSSNRCTSCHESSDHVKRIASADRGIVKYRAAGGEQVAAVAPLAFAGERLVVSVRAERDRLAQLSAGMFALIAVGLGVLLAGATGGVLAWRRAQDRIRAEAEALHKESLERSHGELTALNARLERAASDWRTTADTIDAALIVLEPNGAILRMNLAAAATLPDALPSWLGRPSSRLVEHPPWNGALAVVAQAADLQRVVTERVRDSKNRTWDLWCRALPNRQRSAVLVMARDVTKVVEMEESVRRSETMAQLGAIVSGVAHEVRNPLFAISSLVDAWAVQPHRDPRPFVDALRREVGRLRTLMEDLLEYGRPSGANTARQPERLADVIDGAIAACSHEAVARRVGVVASASADIWVVMDARRFERVFINLIVNAIQHAPADSVVRVETTEPASRPSEVAVTVRDCGPGVAPEDLPRIFTPFFSRRAGGFGLGLAITERIVTEHGGRLAAANDPAGGAVMTVWLPRVSEERALVGREVECA